MRRKGCVPPIALRICILSVTACLPKLEAPGQRADGWRTGSPEAAGIDEKTLARLVARVQRNKIPNIHGILIVEGDRLVFERYFQGYRFAYDKELFRGETVSFDAFTAAGRSKDGEACGYQWWLKTFSGNNEPLRAYVRSGWGGQAIILCPEIDMLVVFTGGNYLGPDPVLDLVREYILPAAANAAGQPIER